MIVVFIYGPAAAGKHTIGTKVADALGVPLFHNHLTVDLALTLFDFGSQPFRNLRATIWRAAFTECALANQSFIFTFHPEATVEPALIDELLSTVKDAGGRVCVVELTCSKEAILARLDSESRRRFGKLTDATLYEAVEAQGGFTFDGLPAPDLQLDTEHLAPDAAAAAILESLGQS